MGRLSFVLLVFICGCSSTPTDPPRNLKICVLNDARAPVQDTSVIRISIEAVSSGYKEKVGIAFEIGEYHDYAGPIWKRVGMHRIYLDDESIVKACNISEINVLFTNHSKEESLGFAYNIALAEASRAYPNIVIFKAEDPPIYLNNPGHPRTWLLMHEIGHLFVGSSHSPNTLSFMFEYTNRSYGQWTRSDRENILRNKYREFSLPPN